jgi:hypothetical protein
MESASKHYQLNKEENKNKKEELIKYDRLILSNK